MTTYAVLPSRLRYSLLILSGTMLAFSFPPFQTGVFAAFAFVPFLIVFQEITSIGKAFQASYVTFFVLNILSLWWVGGFVHGKDIYMMVAGTSLVLGHPLFMFLPILAFTFIRRHLNYTAALVSFPFLWTAFEYLHSINQLAFPWLTLGNTQTYDLATIQVASVTGVYGISFWLAWINVLAYFLYAKLAARVWKPVSGRSVGTALLIIVLYLMPKFYGNLVLQQNDITSDGTPVRVGIVQPNIDPFEKWQTHAEKQLSVLQRMTNDVAAHRVDVVIWPETALPFFVFLPRYDHVLKDVRQQIDSLNVGLFTGIPDFTYYASPEQAPRGSRVIKETGVRYDHFNSSVLVQPHDPRIQKYAKMILVPFAERVPYAELFAVPSWLQWDFGLGGWAIGTDTTVFRLRLQDSTEAFFSNLICYESIYPGFVAQFVRRGAQFLTIITNDSWWDNTFGPYQHQQYAILRAVENRRWIARCANGGISSFIDPFGNVVQSTSMFTQTSLVSEVRARDALTLYTRHGDVFSQFCVIVSGVVIMAAVGRRFYYEYRRKR